MSYLYGTGVTDINVRLRVYFFIFFGIIAMASVLYWKEKTLLAADYVDFPASKHLLISNQAGNN